MLGAQDKQFKIDKSGQIYYQADASNPLPGMVVGTIKKGKSLLDPLVEVNQDVEMLETDKASLEERLNAWVKSYIAETLEPLVKLSDDKKDVPEPVKEISKSVYESLGILPRAEIEEHISKLDADGRRQLRYNKIRLGPILVFIPALNKPAAVKLRGLLWTIWNDNPLPANIPADGLVSFSVETKEDESSLFFRAIGYPVYANRAIRVDMLDRLITAVYDGAEKGKFKARHEMAEWLGSSVSDLYAVLEAMGHKKIHDPADSVPEQVTEEKTEEKAAEKTGDSKPELATFRLRKGKAYGGTKDTKDNKKNYKKKVSKKKGTKKNNDHNSPRIISAAPPSGKKEDSPFAVLEKLKTGAAEKK
jgi:ATP-dependent RNA helicase SUPV3L1/SUV3